jgi:hypothetical protein
MENKVELFETCGQCVHWREADAQGPVTIGSAPRGICFGVPPTPIVAMDPRTKQTGQMNLRPQTLATETACSLYDEGEELPGAANGDIN